MVNYKCMCKQAVSQVISKMEKVVTSDKLHFRLALLARMNVDSFCTHLAFDVAAPVKFAVTSLLNDGFMCIVAAAATHQIASISSR